MVKKHLTNAVLRYCVDKQLNRKIYWKEKLICAYVPTRQLMYVGTYSQCHVTVDIGKDQWSCLTTLHSIVALWVT